MQERLPLVYLHGVVPGRYVATWPVFVVRDRPDELTFSIAVDDVAYSGSARVSGSSARAVRLGGST
jgi:putative restriction endonuclease